MAALLKVLLGALVLLAALAVVVGAVQRRLLYFPPPTDDPGALALAPRLGVEPWLDGRGRFVGWRARSGPAPRATALVLHGNAGSALDRLGYVAALAPRGVEVALLEYPGYPGREGAPTADTLTAAAVEAVDLLAAEGRPIWLVGESLGAGVAARAAAARPEAVRALLLITPFADLAAVMRHHYPLLPPFALRDRFRPAEDLAAWRRPAFVLAAGADEVTTLAQALALHEALPGPKRLSIEEGASHNGLDLSPRAAAWDEAVAFLAGGG